MEIIIHGIRGVYKIFYKTPNVPTSIAGDVRRMEGMEPAAIGQTAYAIIPAGTGFAYSKYIIVRDQSRGVIGNIAVSVYLSAAQQMSGHDIKNLLDELLEGFKNNDEGQQNDWSFIDQLLVNYQHKIRLHPIEPFGESIAKGAADPAFIYYKTIETLCKFFETPLRKEYLPYRQVFFVDAALREQAKNPMNALRHEAEGNLTDKVLLDNPCYRLVGFTGKAINDIDIEIRANDRLLKNGDIVCPKDEIRIFYSKEYSKFIHVGGVLGDEGIGKYIRIHNYTLTVETCVSLKFVSKDVQFQVVDMDGQALTNARLEFEHLVTGEIKPVVVNRVVFKGEEIGQTWRLTYSLNNKKGQLDFVPADATHHTLKLNVRANYGSVGSSIGKKSMLDNWFYSILGLMVFLFGVITYFLLFSNGSKAVPTISEERNIIMYTHGVELDLELLNSYKQQYCSEEGATDLTSSREKNSSTKEDVPFALLPSCSRTSDNTRSASTEKLCERVNKALQIRMAINEGDIGYLKDVVYTYEQQRFKSEIVRIEDSQIAAIQQKLKNLPANLHLNVIADSLNAWRMLAALAAESDAALRKKASQKGNKAEISRLRDRFWDLVEQENLRKNLFDAWYREYSTMVDYTDAYSEFYTVHLMTSEKFERFSRIPRICLRNHSRNLTNLTNTIENPNNCEY